MISFLKRANLATFFIGVTCVVACGSEKSFDPVTFFGPAKIEKVFFIHDQVKLAGELVLPMTEGPHPAVVQVGGSIPTPKEHIAARAHAYALASKGIAVLTYDKRGTGASSGVYYDADYKNFVGDIHAAIDFLKSRRDIDGNALGYVGHSEGGFLMPEVVSQRTDINFAYLRVAPVRDYKSLFHYQIKNRLLNLGLNEEEAFNTLSLQEEINTLHKAVFESPDKKLIQRQLSIQRQIDKLYSQYGSSNMSSVLPRQAIPTNYNKPFFERNIYKWAYSAQLYLEKGVGIPMFYVFGEKDENIDTEASINYLHELQNRGNDKISFYTYLGEDHSLIRPEYLVSGGYPSGYYERMTDWILGVLNESS